MTDRNRTRDALVGGLTTAAYYALPDVVSSRTARFWLKSALLGVSMTTMEGMPTSRAQWEELRTSWRDTFSGATRGDRPDDAPGTDATSPGTSDGTSEGGTSDGSTPASDLLPGDENRATGPLDASQRAVAVGVVAVGLLATTVATVAFERWMYRHGARRAAAGVPFAHTRTGLVAGALVAAGALLPDPSERP